MLEAAVSCVAVGGRPLADGGRCHQGNHACITAKVWTRVGICFFRVPVQGVSDLMLTPSPVAGLSPVNAAV